MMVLPAVLWTLGTLIFIDGLGSMLLPQNHHDPLFDLERLLRAWAGLAIVMVGFYI